MKRWIAALCAAVLLLGFLWFRQPPALRYYRLHRAALESAADGGEAAVELPGEPEHSRTLFRTKDPDRWLRSRLPDGYDVGLLLLTGRLEGTGMGGKGTVRLEAVEGDWYFLDVYLPT